MRELFGTLRCETAFLEAPPSPGCHSIPTGHLSNPGLILVKSRSKGRKPTSSAQRRVMASIPTECLSLLDGLLAISSEPQLQNCDRPNS